MSDLFQEHERITFTVKAATVSPLNIVELAEATGGTLMHDGPKEGNFSRDYIKIDTTNPRSERQTQAYIGDVIVQQGRTYRIYPAGQFRQQFRLKESITMPVKTHPKPAKKQEKRKGPRNAGRPQGAPNPGNMPKKRAEVLEGNAAAVAPSVSQVTQSITDARIRSVGLVPDTPENRAAGAGSVEITSPEAAAVRRHEELSENGVTDGQEPERVQLGDPELGAMGLPQSFQEGYRPVYLDEIDSTERILQTSFGETAEQAASRRMLEEKAAAEAAAKPKPITLDELESRPGDPRTATEINLNG